MGTKGRWYFKFKGAALDNIYEATADGCSNDAPTIIREANSGCQDGSVYHIVASNRGNARYSSDLAFSTCLSGSLVLIQATFTADPNVNIQCGPEIFDCLNGACIDKDTYKTPGLYQSEEECQVACGPGCSGVCLTASEWSTIQGLAGQNKSRHCG